MLVSLAVNWQFSQIIRLDETLLFMYFDQQRLVLATLQQQAIIQDSECYVDFLLNL